MEEQNVVPYETVEPPGENVLVLAPHPDDEIIGLGGSISLLKKNGRDVTVVFITSGDMADKEHKLSKIVYDSPHMTAYSRMREKEAISALKVLDVEKCLFLEYPDRMVSSNHSAIYKELDSLVNSFDVVYSPSPMELHPDHRATAVVAMELQGKHNFRLVFYEVSVPLRPTLLVDITKSADRKWKAIKTYKSQLKLNNYLDIAMALNKYRTLTVGSQCEYVEAFMEVKQKDDEKLSKWLSYQTEFRQ